MITQQVASYLIKKMEAAIKKPGDKATDETDELFKSYLALKSDRRSSDVITDGRINNETIVEAFRWRAADLVSMSNVTVFYRLTAAPELPSLP
jgi:acyl-CoA oxidase